MMRTVSDADRGQLARKIRSSRTFNYQKQFVCKSRILKLR